MNAALAIQPSFNLLRIQPSPLTQSDLEKLSRSGISPELAEANHLFRVASWEAKELVGIRGDGDFSGIVFPYQDIRGNQNIRYSLRLDRPPMERKSDGTMKEAGKYRREPGTNHIFLPWSEHPGDLRSTERPLVIVEGEKKSIALQGYAHQAGATHMVVAIPGVWNWRGRIGKTFDQDGTAIDVKGAIPDFNEIEFFGREVIILFDSNVRSNPEVLRARAALSRYLHNERKANVFWAEVPDLPGVNGIDDLIGLYPEKIHDVWAGIIPYVPPAEAHPLTPHIPKENRMKWDEILDGIHDEPFPTVATIETQPVTAEGFSRAFIEVVVRGLAEAGFSDKGSRATFAIMSRLDGNQRQPMPYAALYPLLSKCGDDIPKKLNSSQQRTVREYIQALEADQIQTGITIFTIDPGFKKAEETHPTMVDPEPLFQLLALVDELAKDEPGYGRNKTQARSRVMAAALAQLFDKFIRPQVKPKKTAAKKNDSDAKRTASALTGFFQRMMDQGISVNAAIDALAEHLPQALQPILNQLAERLEPMPDGDGIEAKTTQKCNVFKKEDSTFFAPNPGPELARSIANDRGDFESFGEKNGRPLAEKALELKSPEIEKHVLWAHPEVAENKDVTGVTTCSTCTSDETFLPQENPTEHAETEIETYRRAYHRIRDFAETAGDAMKDQLKGLGGLPFYFRIKGLLESLSGGGLELNLKKLHEPPEKNTQDLFYSLMDSSQMLGGLLDG
jgi:hypothetical protein